MESKTREMIVDSLIFALVEGHTQVAQAGAAA